MKNLFEMLQAIFGKNIISGTIGTRTNVIKLPTNKSNPLKNEFDVVRSAENPAVFQKLKKVIEDEAPYISRMNDAERLIYEGNVKRLHDYLVSIGEIKPTITAEVIGLTTKEPIAGKGLEELIQKQGTVNPPTTIAGQLETQGKKLEKVGEDLKEVTEQKPESVIGDIMKDYGKFQKVMQDAKKTGYVRATVRQIMREDIQAGKLKLPKELEDQVMQGVGEPIDVWRKVYGEGALEQIDSIANDLGKLRTEEEAAKFVRSKFTFEPDINRPPGSYAPEEEGTKGLDYLTGQEPPEKKANGGRIGFKAGSGKKVLDLILEANKKLKDKKSMETVNPKTGEVTTPKEPVMTADKKRQLTKEEIEDYEEQLGDSETWMSEGTVEEAENALKRSKAEEAYYRTQYKMGKLDPEPGEKTQDRLKFLRDKAEYAEDVKDRRLFTLDEMNELDELEKIFEPRGSSNINISDPKTAESFTNFIKENDPEGFKKIQKIVDDINNRNTLKKFDIKDREPNAKGGSVGLGYLAGE